MLSERAGACSSFPDLFVSEQPEKRGGGEGKGGIKGRGD